MVLGRGPTADKDKPRHLYSRAAAAAAAAPHPEVKAAAAGSTRVKAPTDAAAVGGNQPVAPSSDRADRATGQAYNKPAPTDSCKSRTKWGYNMKRLAITLLLALTIQP